VCVTQPDKHTIIESSRRFQERSSIFRPFFEFLLLVTYGTVFTVTPRLARLVFLPTFGWNLLLGRVFKVRNWWDAVEPRLLLGARPLRRDVATFSNLQIDSVVNLCEEFRGPVDLYAKYSIQQLWLPTTDFQPPSLEQIDQGVEYIEARLNQATTNHGKVYVHCKAGRARSATIVLCWMIKYRGMTSESAQRRLLEVRPHVNPSLHQRPVIREFEQLFTTKSV